MRTNADLGLFILRVSTGAMMLMAHGWGKLVGFSHIAPHFPDPIGLGSTISLAMAVFAEFFCSIALIGGVLTRYAAIPLAITMLVAAFVVHADDPWGKKEFALLYFFPFLVIYFTGPGKYSIDRMFLNRN